MSEVPAPVADLVSAADVQRLAPALSSESADLLARALSATVRRVAPCFAAEVTDDQRAEASWVATQAIQRLAEARSWHRAKSTGPYRVDFGEIPESIFSAAEEAKLAGICSAVAHSPRVASRGSFPDSAGLESLFASRTLPPVGW